MDGSEYVENNEDWITAINMRKKENKEWINQFKDAVNQHWKNKTIPTKFSTNDSWEKNYKNQAELAHDVAYPYLRVILMGLMMQSMGSDCKVIALNKDGSATEYPSGKEKRRK